MSVTEKDLEFRRVIALEDDGDLQHVLELALTHNICTPIKTSREDLNEKYGIDIESSEIVSYDYVLLFYSRKKDDLNKLKEIILQNDVDAYISSVL